MNIAWRPELRRGRKPGPDVIAGERNVLPAERGDMRKEFSGRKPTLPWLQRHEPADRRLEFARRRCARHRRTR